MQFNPSPGQQYGVPLSIYQERYALLDPASTQLRTGAKYDPDRGAFVLNVMGYGLLASWPDFSLKPENPDGCPSSLYDDVNKILIIRYLLEGVNSPPSGAWLPYRELPWGDVYDRNFQGRCIRRLAGVFGSRLDSFVTACEAAGGVPAPVGDISYDLDFLPNIRSRLILWAGDEEFPPHAQWLFSDNTPLAFTAEDAAGLGDVVINTLKILANAKT